MKSTLSPIQFAKTVMMASLGAFSRPPENKTTNETLGNSPHISRGTSAKKSIDFVPRLAPPDWTSRCWAEVGGYGGEGPGSFTRDFFRGRNISYVDLIRGNEGAFIADFGNMQFRAKNGIYANRIYTGDTELPDHLVNTYDTRDRKDGATRRVSIELPEGQAKQRLTHTFKDGFGFSEYRSKGVIGVDGANFWNSYVGSSFDAGLYAAKGCAKNHTPKTPPEQVIIPDSVPIWKSIMWNDDGGHVLNHDTGYAREGTLRSTPLFDGDNGCYVACYSHRQDLQKNRTYSINKRTTVVGQLRISGLYAEGSCLPTGLTPETDLSTNQTWVQACADHFEECNPCWPGGDTGGSFSLYGRWTR